MELDLNAISNVLEKLLKSSNKENNLNLISKQKPKRPVFLKVPSNRNFINSTYIDKNEQEDKELNLEKNINQKNEKILNSSHKINLQKQRTHQKTLMTFTPSIHIVRCKVIEASGLGASSVLLTDSTTRKKMKRYVDKIWTTNLYHNPTPYVVLNLFSKKDIRKEVILHTSPTTKSPGIRIERLQDIVLSILYDSMTEGLDTIGNFIERLVISCSNHPRTNYVSILSVKNIEGPLLRVILPGTLIGPFIKVTFFPKDTIQIKVLRISIMELAFADSWTERRIIEETLLSTSDENNNEKEKEEEKKENEKNEEINQCVNFENKIKKTVKEREVEDQHVHDFTTLTLEKIKTKTQGYSSVNSTAPISPVRIVQEDNDSVLDACELQDRCHHTELVKTDTKMAKIERTEKIVRDIKEKYIHMHKQNVEEHGVRSVKQVNQQETEVCVHDENCNRTSYSSGRNNSFAPCMLREDICITEGNLCEKQETQPPVLLRQQSDSPVVKAPATVIEPHQESVSKALIAWNVKRRILQDTNIMQYLQEEEENILSERDQFDMYSSLGTNIQAHHIWEEVTHLSRRDALLEIMKTSSSFSFTIACTFDEILASLSQPYALQLLLIICEEREGQSSSSSSSSSSMDSFNLMMMIARGERRRGREAQLMFRTTNGFCCLLHSRRDVVCNERQWLLVSTLNDKTTVNEWLLETFRVNEMINQCTYLYKQEESRDFSSPLFKTNNGLIVSSKPAILRSVLDFACLFEDLLPALRSWLVIGDMCYYGDVHPVLHPFMDDCGVIYPTSWFQCILQGTVKSVLLSLLGGEHGRRMSGGGSKKLSSRVRRRLVCLTLSRHLPLYAVWQSHIHAVKVVLSNTHMLHHVDLLDGVVMSRREMMTAEALSPQSRDKFELLNDSDISVLRAPLLFDENAVTVGKVFPSETAEAISAMAFHVLSTALRRSWKVVGLTLSTCAVFDEDAFMDTVFRWAYALPRVIVLFYTDHIGKESSPQPSTGFIEAFAPVGNMRSALTITALGA